MSSFGTDISGIVDISGKSIGYVRPTQKLYSQLSFLSYEAPNWMKLGHEGHLNTRNTFPKEGFLKSKYFLFDLGLTKKSRVCR
jgi:hypothetical protein